MTVTGISGCILLTGIYSAIWYSVRARGELEMDVQLKLTRGGLLCIMATEQTGAYVPFESCNQLNGSRILMS
ncbi:hypothetical protein V1506DRAFT_533050 [Lipomyces tetrasporus]